jgi:signal transduction histidine kinase
MAVGLDYETAKRTLLVVDDEEAVRAVVAALFEPAGFTVLTAADGRAALDILDRETVGVALIDKNLDGGMSGLEVLRTLHERGSRTRAIMITGFGSTESAVEALRFRAHDYLTKPFEIDVLEKSVAGAIEALRLDVERDQLLQQLVSELRHARDADAIGQLAGGVAHDFKNIISVIVAEAELIRDKLPDSDPLRPDLTEIIHCAERGIRLTRQLLALIRKQARGSDSLHLGEAVAEMETMLRRLVGERIILDLASDADLGRVSADRSQIEQIILNLAANARDALPDGGTLRVATGNARIDDAVSGTRPCGVPGQYVVLSVSDDGVGIPEEIRERIFEPYFTTKENGSGTGLGLAVVKEIATAAGGHVGVSSEVSRGTTVRVFLPRIDNEVGEPTVVSRAVQVAALDSALVLLVEDDADLRRAGVRALARAGYAVAGAQDADEAVELFSSVGAPPDVLVTDIVMPGTDGAELARMLRDRHAGLRIVYISGCVGPASREHRMLAGASVFLPKPFETADLVATVGEVLKKPVN